MGMDGGSSTSDIFLSSAAGSEDIITVNGILGQSVTFPLNIQDSQNVENIVWYTTETSVAFVKPNLVTAVPEVSVTHQSYHGRINVSDKNFDLVISLLRKQDSRIYQADINSKDKSTKSQRFSLHVYKQLGMATITSHVKPTGNGTCNVTLTCSVEEGENVTFSWTPLGVGPILHLSQGPGGREGAITCTAQNPVSSSNASMDAKSLCTDVARGSQLHHKWMLSVMLLPILLLLAVGLLLLFCRRRRQLQPHLDASSEKTQYAQAGVTRLAESHIYDDISLSKVVPSKEDLTIYSKVQRSDKTNSQESRPSKMSNYAIVD
ncbi:SLAM family member 5-like [Suncus etruscus]|uniref:SLAM family member 5-like n=1 Tax=Suncus etruscus TaxID=109475 RepID=UPI002110C864|nr:SLAM family member 5-like [Suncus etruscus]